MRHASSLKRQQAQPDSQKVSRRKYFHRCFIGFRNVRAALQKIKATKNLRALRMIAKANTSVIDPFNSF
jgi:hypothetical protein